MSDPTLSDIDFKNIMARVWTTLNSFWEFQMIKISLQFSWPTWPREVNRTTNISLDLLSLINEKPPSGFPQIQYLWFENTDHAIGNFYETNTTTEPSPMCSGDYVTKSEEVIPTLKVHINATTTRYRTIKIKFNKMQKITKQVLLSAWTHFIVASHSFILFRD